MGSLIALLLLFLHSLALLAPIPTVCQVTEFISIDCGGSSNSTDKTTGLDWISDAGMVTHGNPQGVSNPNAQGKQYEQRRDFPSDNNKYCYKLPTQERRRYLVRATFLYGSSEDVGTYPSFELHLDATGWATITILDGVRLYVEEMIVRAPSDAVDVCLCCATTGSPFLSTLELRPLNLSMYATDFEDGFYLKVAARVREYPPVKVMQTAVVGTQGKLSYRLNLEDFPATARAFAFFAEIESLKPNETRKFKMAQPYIPDYSDAVVNIAENANGSYRLYEPSYMNVSFEFVLSFSFVKTPDSTKGPLLNAIEISKYVEIGSKTDRDDVTALRAFSGMSLGTLNTEDEGDPCNPKPWEWVICSSTSPPRVTKLLLSRKNLTGTIPSELQNMDGLIELWLDSNSLTGPIPDISNLVNLRIIHLENNRRDGTIPPYLSTLPSLQELYIQNNGFSGKIPPGLLARKVHFRCSNTYHSIAWNIPTVPSQKEDINAGE